MAVMPALVAGIHDLTAPVAKKTWMAGPSPAMTEEGARVTWTPDRATRVRGMVSLMPRSRSGR